MNLLEAYGTAQLALDGRRILVVLARPEKIKLAFDAIEKQALFVSDNVRSTRSSGREMIDIGPRGRIVFTTQKSSRNIGNDADVVILDEAMRAPQEWHDRADQLVAPVGGTVVRR